MELSSLIVALSLINSNQESGKILPGSTPAILFANPPAPETMVFFLKESAYSHWQNLAIDRLGNLRPRVVYSPQGAYYLYNGMSYPFVESRRGNFAPTELGFRSFYMPYAEEIIIEEKK